MDCDFYDRAAVATDLNSVCDLGAIAFSNFGDYRKTIAYWFEQPSSEVWVACKACSVVGFVITAIGFESANNADMLVALAVDPAHQRNGIGRALIAGVLKRRADADGRLSVGCHLNVADDNRAALALFKTLGFQTFGCESTYPSGQRALRLIKEAGTRVTG
ncbi:MAG: GNAT family N-acetyltransferase [Myxococcota bacterium]|nr:GNAT family N-acetyltransferase [Myxococcota bacterium]